MWTVARLVTTPPPAPGFIGEGHTAVEVVTSDDLPATDPFVLLTDDRLDIRRRRQIAGEPIAEPLVHRGPFVAGTPELAEYHLRFRAGEFALLSELHR
jgi:redox-sensitive bicupin YhaK (pirin superfamily)